MTDTSEKPVAWSYELAGYYNAGRARYDGWKKQLTDYAPNVPEGSIRNLQPLYTRPTVSADAREALGKPRLEDEVAWAILQALHENVPEAERPMSWSDVNGEQEKRLRAAAYTAMTKTVEFLSWADAALSPPPSPDRMREALTEILSAWKQYRDGPNPGWDRPMVNAIAKGGAALSQEAPADGPGMDWKLSEEATKAITEIEQHPWTDVTPENPLPDDLKVGDEIEITFDGGSPERYLIEAVELLRSGGFMYWAADAGWHKSITAFRRSGDR